MKKPIVRAKDHVRSACSSCSRGCPIADLIRRREALPATALAEETDRHDGQIVGFLNINKPPGMTSHDVVAAVRRASGERRVGHAGTLDPMATGVLVVGMGQATRLIEYLMHGRKVYRAQIHFGLSTDTLDAEGQVTRRVEDIDLDITDIETLLPDFIGRIEQVPPMYSALKRGGQPLYKLARRGITVPRKPRLVEIHDIEVLNWELPVLEVRVTCGRGTYIRALARDLGERMGCGAHLKSLVREASGRFKINMSEPLDVVEDSFRHNYWQALIHPPDEALLDFDAMIVDRQTAEKIKHGHKIAGRGPLSTSLCRAYTVDGEFIALMEHDPNRGLWQPRKVFHCSF